ncbi:nucleolar GTP-binding protein 1 [Rhypophila decipiens]|uniref:Nucleolar GTP-binding protein 1 n=1 Tax=Rhypophila decipiens TaxID=261697 RepID=A0AAN6YCN3_9PEZI|nr:nucleolar GTP-binding protein 1 [Rhypophila decipiens]
MASYDIVLLLLGPTRSGKTTFVTSLAARPKDGKMQNGSTVECKDYETTVSGKDFLIIDTPGLDDSPAGNLEVLGKIAVKLRSSPHVNAVIYFHRITTTRLTGSARSNIDLFLQICGKVFLGQTAFVTTMWNNISTRERTRFDHLNEELRGKILSQTQNLTHFFEFDSNNRGSAVAVLKHFAESKKLAIRPQRLALARELDEFGSATPSNVRRTTAGKQVVKDMNRGFCLIF